MDDGTGTSLAKLGSLLRALSVTGAKLDPLQEEAKEFMTKARKPGANDRSEDCNAGEDRDSQALAELSSFLATCAEQLGVGTFRYRKSAQQCSAGTAPESNNTLQNVL